MSAPAVSVPPREAINAGAAAIDYWLCENDQCIELSSQIRDMFAEGLTAALPALERQIRAQVTREILSAPTSIGWAVRMSADDGATEISQHPSEKSAREHQAIDQEWLDAGDTDWCAPYTSSQVVQRTVTEWVPAEQESRRETFDPAHAAPKSKEEA